jgi:protein-S-isoprenylcysteine O-methyltransferase Ste14
MERRKKMSRIPSFFYGLVAYLVFFGTILYAIGFVTGLPVPKDIDAGAAGPLAEALIVNIALMSLFAIQHSVMARKGFKRWWTKIVPPIIERSTYVLLASLSLLLLFWQWRPIPAVVWQAPEPVVSMALTVFSLFGWVVVFASTFMINHFELFGLQQVVLNLRGRTAGELRFKTPMLYGFVRHPIYLGFIIAFWSASTMTVGHLLFATVTTAYIFVGIMLEERDLVAEFGDEYQDYRSRVGMVLPKLPREREGAARGQASFDNRASSEHG